MKSLTKLVLSSTIIALLSGCSGKDTPTDNSAVVSSESSVNSSDETLETIDVEPTVITTTLNSTDGSATGESLVIIDIPSTPETPISGSTDSPKTDETTATTDKPPASITRVSNAINSGDARLAESAEELVNAYTTELNAVKSRFNLYSAALYKLNDDNSEGPQSLTGIEWNPSHDAALLTPTFGTNTAVLQTNGNQAGNFSGNGNALAIAGELHGSRYLVLGSNPTRIDTSRNNHNTINDKMQLFLENSIEWLSGLDTENIKKVTLAHVDNETWFKDDSALRGWLKESINSDVEINEFEACNNEALAGCLVDTELLIISQHVAASDNTSDIAATVESAMAQGVPVLYVHRNGDLGSLAKSLFSVLSVNYTGDNKNLKELIVGASASSTLNYIPKYLQKIQTTLTHLINDDFSFDLNTGCDDKGCYELPDTWQTEFLTGAQAIRTLTNQLDSNRIDIFSMPGRIADKLAILSADFFRQQIQYPLKRPDVSTSTWLSAYFADHAVYNYRVVNPAQPDLGNFSRTDFSHIVPTTRNVNLTTLGSFRATGAYALPGQTFRVTRLDDNTNVSTSISVNTLRSGSTREWLDRWDGYNRPKYLKSQSISVGVGKTIYLTSPYGGPIQVSYNKEGESIQLAIENIGEHPYWGSTSDNEKFAQAITANDFDWVEISAASFEVHSRYSYFIQTITGQKFWDDAETLVTASMQYSHNYPNLLAGLQGEGIDRVEEIHGWAEELGYNIATTTKLQHMNADQATCGALCSGNPYDSNGPYNPISHGDLHEIGHGIQLAPALLTYGGQKTGSHSATNFYSSYTSQRFFEDTGAHKPDTAETYKHTFCATATDDPGSHIRPMFDKAVAAASAVDPLLAMDAALAPDTIVGDSHEGYNYRVFEQLRYQARHWERLDNGYHLIARLHIHWKNFTAARNNDDTWAAKKDLLGMSTYSVTEAKALNNNDWLLIASSWALDLNFVDHIGMMGIITSSKAKEQVESFNFSKVNKEIIAGNNGCATSISNSRALSLTTPFEKHIIAINADAIWPWE